MVKENDLPRLRARWRTIARVLGKLFPDARIALNFSNEWELLVAVQLSAQCTDKKVNEVTPALFKKYPTLAAYVRAGKTPAGVHAFEQSIKQCGFYHAKARNILAAARDVTARFKGKLPRTMAEMVTVPGVGRKSANVILGNAHGVVEGIAVDTHVMRLSRVLGLTTEKTPEKIETDLMKIIPRKDWFKATYLIIEYGRKYCVARPHDHAHCPLTAPLSKLRAAFTLIELLVVIAIIAILAVVVVLTLNPAQLLAQSRDANRVADMATLSSALNLYQTDLSGTSGYSLGNASSGYMSYPSASSACGDLGLLALPSGDSWKCSPSASYRKADGTGWIPVNFSFISSGAPFGSLPIDPTNSTSSGLFYTYGTSGSKYEVTANLESAKYRQNYENNPRAKSFPGIAYGGTPGISLLYNSAGLVGYWSFEEGGGTAVNDDSGNGVNGTWNGTPAAPSGGYYAAGKVGSYAGYFNGTNDFVDLGNPPGFPSGQVPVTLCSWGELNSIPGGFGWMASFGTPATSEAFFIGTDGNGLNAGGYGNGFGIANYWSTGQWHFICNVYDGTTAFIYADGSLIASGAKSWNMIHQHAYLGKQVNTLNEYWSGLVDDVRIYSRALSPAEVLALYNMEK